MSTQRRKARPTHEDGAPPQPHRRGSGKDYKSAGMNSPPLLQPAYTFNDRTGKTRKRNAATFLRRCVTSLPASSPTQEYTQVRVSSQTRQVSDSMLGSRPPLGLLAPETPGEPGPARFFDSKSNGNRKTGECGACEWSESGSFVAEAPWVDWTDACEPGGWCGRLTCCTPSWPDRFPQCRTLRWCCTEG